jgi:hypothetical protein
VGGDRSDEFWGDEVPLLEVAFRFQEKESEYPGLEIPSRRRRRVSLPVTHSKTSCSGKFTSAS